MAVHLSLIPETIIIIGPSEYEHNYVYTELGRCDSLPLCSSPESCFSVSTVMSSLYEPESRGWVVGYI